MRKTEAIRIICQAAKTYDEQLCNKKLLIIYNAPNKPEFIEALASPSNFLHLTGIKLNSSNSADSFYRDACDRKIKESDFDFKDHTTEQKLNVLVQTLRISTNAKIIGDFNNSGIKLQTDKLAGGVYSSLGFVKTDNSYVPNTVLEGDIRQIANDRRKVLAIIRKHIDEPSYNEVKYVAKNIDIQRLLAKIKDKVSIDEKLLSRDSNELSPINVNKISYSPISYSGGAAVLSPNAPSISVRSFFENMRNNITGKKIKQQYERLKEEITDLKEQLFQKDRQIAKKDDMIANLTKKVEDVTAERDEFKKVCDFQKNVIKRTNQWLNANLDVKKRLIQDKKEQASVFAPKPSEQTIKQAHKAKSKKGRS